MFEQVYAVEDSHNRWTKLPFAQRRLQCWGGLVKSPVTKSEPLPTWLQVIAEQLRCSGILDQNEEGLSMYVFVICRLILIALFALLALPNASQSRAAQ